MAAVTHPDGIDASGRLFEVGAGFIAEVRWERSKGVVFKTDATFTPSAVQAQWEQITDFDSDPQQYVPAFTESVSSSEPRQSYNCSRFRSSGMFSVHDIE